MVIIQNNTGNRYSPTVIAAAITSRVEKRSLPTHIRLGSNTCGLPYESVVLLEQLQTIDKTRLENDLGRIDNMNQIDDAIAISLGLNKNTMQVAACM